MSSKLLVMAVTVLLLAGCASDPVGPAMANCVRYFFAQASSDAPDTDWNDWAVQGCNANLKELGEAEFIKLWSN